MTTVATRPSSATAQNGPSEPTIEQIDAGLDDDLVAAAFEDLDDDPVVASLQADRDRLAARGDFDGARAANQRVVEMRDVQHTADAAADRFGSLRSHLAAEPEREVRA